MISPFMDSSKRKREDPQAPTPPDSSPICLQTSINLPTFSPEEAGPGSPRTKVTYHFQGLALDGPTDTKKLSLEKKEQEAADCESNMRKRVKLFASTDVDMTTGSTVTEIPETPQAKPFKDVIGDEGKADPIIREIGNDTRLHNETGPIIFRAGLSDAQGNDALTRACSSVNPVAEFEFRGQKRMSTPPSSKSEDAVEEQRASVNQDRATLISHNNKITGHKPDDPDDEDDGEGINGIGYRPTAAVALARSERRKQQMADYRSREAREARARRSERRQGTEDSDRKKAENAARRVRFLDSDNPEIIPTSWAF